jgi:hypothetical protein
MARALSLSLLFLLLAPVIKAQETPQYEVFVGPSYAREDLTNIKFINGIGWHASLDGTASVFNVFNNFGESASRSK